MSDLHVEVHGPADGERVILVHGSMSTGAEAWALQLELAGRYRLLIPDRRGYGRSPHVEEIGWHHDGQDIAELLAEGDAAHLVGHSYGGVAALLAAGLRPEAVRSLTVIEPPAFEMARGDADVDELIASMLPVYARAGEMTTTEFFVTWNKAFGSLEIPTDLSDFPEEAVASIEATRRERWPGDAPIPTERLRAAPFPKTAISGAWPGDLRWTTVRTARAFQVTARVIADAIGARLVTFDRSTHSTNREEPEKFNAFLRDLWGEAAPSAGGRWNP